MCSCSPGEGDDFPGFKCWSELLLMGRRVILYCSSSFNLFEECLGQITFAETSNVKCESKICVNIPNDIPNWSTNRLHLCKL